jgi:hypothetical protein
MNKLFAAAGLGAAALGLAAGLAACGGGNSATPYANGKAYAVAAWGAKASQARLTMTPRHLCSMVLTNAPHDTVPGLSLNAPASEVGDAQWVAGCVVGVRQSGVVISDNRPSTAKVCKSVLGEEASDGTAIESCRIDPDTGALTAPPVVDSIGGSTIHCLLTFSDGYTYHATATLYPNGNTDWNTIGNSIN